MNMILDIFDNNNVRLYHQRGYNKKIRKDILFFESGLYDLREMIKYSINGKPYLEEGPALSCSETSNDSILAFTKDYATIGVDIEVEKPSSYYPFIVQNYFRSEERQYCIIDENSSINISRFFEIWVKKEAIIKSMGGSIYNDMLACNVFCSNYFGKLLYKKLDLSKIYHIAICFS